MLNLYYEFPTLWVCRVFPTTEFPVTHVETVELYETVFFRATIQDNPDSLPRSHLNEIYVRTRK